MSDLDELKNLLKRHDIDVAENGNVSWVQVWATRLVWLMVTLPLVLSFASLTDYARQNGVVYPFIFALVVDVGQLVFKLVAFRSSLRGQTDWLAWSLTIVAVIVSATLNVMHVDESVVKHVGVARFMAGFPPILMFLSVFLVAKMTKESIQERQTITAVNDSHRMAMANIEALEGIETEKTKLGAELERLQSEIAQLSKRKETAVSKYRKIEEVLESKQATLESIEDDIQQAQSRLMSLTAVTTNASHTTPNGNDGTSNDKLKSNVANTVIVGDIDMTPPDKKPSSEQRRDFVMTVLRQVDNDNWTDFYKPLAEWGHVSERTIQRDVSQLNGRLSS